MILPKIIASSFCVANPELDPQDPYVLGLLDPDPDPLGTDPSVIKQKN